MTKDNWETTTLQGLIDRDICEEALSATIGYLEDRGSFTNVTKAQNPAWDEFLFASDDSSTTNPPSTSSSPSNLSRLMAISAQETQVLEDMKVGHACLNEDIFSERHITERGCSLLRVKSFKLNLSELGHGYLE